MNPDLEGVLCGLDHPDAFPPQQAVDVLVIPVDNGVIQIPVCQICLNSLHDINDGWTLFLCISCGAVKWMHEEQFESSEPIEGKVWALHTCPLCPERLNQ